MYHLIEYGDVMLERYKVIEGLVKIPFTSTAVDINGNVYSEYGQIIPYRFNENNEPIIFANLWYGFQDYKISEIMAFTYKNCHLPLERWKEVTVMHIDGNPSNIHPINLVWKFPKGGLFHHRYVEFAYIPGFTRYVINKQGEVITLISDRHLTSHNTNGYKGYSLSPDVGRNISIGRHRLMAFAFLEYPANVDILDVNHISGIRGDDRLENLEWATRQRNCQHAFENGLRPDNQEVLVRNFISGEIREFYSIEECARVMKLSGEGTRSRVNSRGQYIYPDFFQFKRKNDPTPWRDFENPETDIYRSGIARKIKVRDIRTNKVTVYDSAIKCGKELGFSKATVLWQLRENRIKRPHRGYDFKWFDDDSDWQTYDDIEIECHLGNPVTIAKPIIVTDILTGEEKIYYNVDLFSKEIDRAKCTIYQFMREDKLIKNQYRVKWLNTDVLS